MFRILLLFQWHSLWRTYANEKQVRANKIFKRFKHIFLSYYSFTTLFKWVYSVSLFLLNTSKNILFGNDTCFHMAFAVTDCQLLPLCFTVYKDNLLLLCYFSKSNIALLHTYNTVIYKCWHDNSHLGILDFTDLFYKVR